MMEDFIITDHAAERYDTRIQKEKPQKGNHKANP